MRWCHIEYARPSSEWSDVLSNQVLTFGWISIQLFLFLSNNQAHGGQEGNMSLRLRPYQKT